MEVSSHAVKLLRVHGLEFKIVLITNLTRDHLDFHQTMEDYKYTKALFLRSADERSYVIINSEICEFKLFYRLARGRVLTYGENNADYTFEDPKFTIDGTEFLYILRVGNSKSRPIFSADSIYITFLLSSPSSTSSRFSPKIFRVFERPN